MGHDSRKYNLIALCIIILSVGFYASPLILNSGSYFTLFPKNIPTFYSNYNPGFFLRDSILNFRRFPLWIPIFEGGRAPFEYPFDISLSPFAVLSVLFGEAQGINISWFVTFIFGALSMFYLARFVLAYDVFGSIFSALVFSMSGLFPYLFENGVICSRDVMLLPLLLAFFIKARDNRKYLILCSFVLSLMLVSTILFFPVVLLFLFMFSCTYGLEHNGSKPGERGSYLRAFMLVCVITVFLSSVKIIPFLDLFSLNNRISAAGYRDAIQGANDFPLFLQRLLLPFSSGPGTMYTGLLPLILCIFASILSFRQIKRYVLILLVFIVLSFGPNIFPDLHRVLWSFPFFNSMREISKYYALIIVFLVSLIAGRAFMPMLKLKPGFLSVLFPVIIIVFVYSDLLNSNTGYFNSFNTRLNYKPSAGEIFHVKGLNLHQGDESVSGQLFYFLAKKNVGLLNFEFFLRLKSNVAPKYYLLPKYAFLMPYTALFSFPNPDYKGEVYFTETGCKAELAEMSPGVIAVKVDMPVPGRLVINQNYSRNWRSDKGTVEDYNGLISVRFDKKEDGLVRLAYLPKLFFLGAAVTLIALIICLYKLIR